MIILITVLSQIGMMLSSVSQMTLRMSAGLLQGVAQSHSVIRLEPHLGFIWFVLFELSNYESLYPTQKRCTGWEENMLPAA